MQEKLSRDDVRQIMRETYGRGASTWVKVDLALEIGLLEAKQKVMGYEEAVEVGWNKVWTNKKKITPVVYDYIYNERLPFKILLREGMENIKSNSFLMRAMTVVAIQTAILAGKDELTAGMYAREALNIFDSLTWREWNGINGMIDKTVRWYSTFGRFNEEIKNLIEANRNEIEKVWSMFQTESRKRFSIRIDSEESEMQIVEKATEEIKEVTDTTELIIERTVISESSEPEKCLSVDIKEEKEELLEDYAKRICELEKTVSFLLNDNKRLRDAQENSFIQGMGFLLENMSSDGFGNPLGELMLEARKNETLDKKNRIGFLAQSLQESLLYSKLSLLDEELDCEVTAEEVFKSGKYRLDVLKNYEGEQGTFKVIYPGWEYRNMVLVKPSVEKQEEENKNETLLCNRFGDIND